MGIFKEGSPVAVWMISTARLKSRGEQNVERPRLGGERAERRFSASGVELRKISQRIRPFELILSSDDALKIDPTVCRVFF